jgi:hypothetical protein
MRLAFDVIAKHVTLGQAELLLGEARTGAAELDTSTRIWSQCGKDLCVRQSWNQGSHKPFNKKWGERCPFSPLFGDITMGHRRSVRGRHDGKQGSFTFCLFVRPSDESLCRVFGGRKIEVSLALGFGDRLCVTPRLLVSVAPARTLCVSFISPNPPAPSPPRDRTPVAFFHSYW